VLAGCLLPLVVLGVRAARGGLGANPITEAINQLGLLALLSLLLSLACTPLRILGGWSWPIRIRKTLGVMAFVFACLHFLTYIGLDRVFALRAILADVAERPFLAVGFAALVLMAPLAATSTAAMLKRLGAARWRRLHRLAYVVAILGIVHFVMRVKKDVSEPLVYGALLALLFGVRIFEWARRRAPAKPAAGNVGS
jgi:sulfoxide reductase heme-binding subunit YedZ